MGGADGLPGLKMTGWSGGYTVSLPRGPGPGGGGMLGGRMGGGGLPRPWGAGLGPPNE